MKKIVIFLSSLLVIGLIVGFSLTWLKSDKDTEEKPKKTNTESTETKKEDTLHVSIFPGHSFTSDDTVQFDTLTIDDAVKKVNRFVLISKDETVTPDMKVYLNKLISAKKVVLFYGSDVDPSNVRDQLGVDMTISYVEGTVPTIFLLYGYGYSNKYEKEMSYFLSSNSFSESTIKEYLSDNRSH